MEVALPKMLQSENPGLAQAPAKAIGCFAPWFPPIYVSTFPAQNAGNPISFLNWTYSPQSLRAHPVSIAVDLTA